MMLTIVKMHNCLSEIPKFCDFCCQNHPPLIFRFRPLQLYLIIVILNMKGTHFKAAEMRGSVHERRCSEEAQSPK